MRRRRYTARQNDCRESRGRAIISLSRIWMLTQRRIRFQKLAFRRPVVRERRLFIVARVHEVDTFREYPDAGLTSRE